jgi:hypothetical protein
VERGPVDIRIHDVMGRLVRSLHVPASTQPETRRVTWDGRNHVGQRVTPGIYLYHLRAGSRLGTGKMTILE